jgi:hypothetical protein
MLHINSQGEEYIWNKFVESCISPKSREIIAKWKKITSRLGHQFFNKQGTAYREFLQTTLTDLKEIATEIDISEETANISKLLSELPSFQF